jgi:hypothetical protein
VLIVHARTPEGDTNLEFALAAGGMTLGVSAAIWLARRFDELEARWTKEAAKRRADALAGGVREGENR